MFDLALLDATAQAEMVRNGEVSPTELVEAAIARVEQVNPALNAIIHERFDRALDEAADVRDGPFRGVPIVVKDYDGSRTSPTTSATAEGDRLHRGPRLYSSRSSRRRGS